MASTSPELINVEELSPAEGPHPMRDEVPSLGPDLEIHTLDELVSDVRRRRGPVGTAASGIGCGSPGVPEPPPPSRLMPRSAETTAAPIPTATAVTTFDPPAGAGAAGPSLSRGLRRPDAARAGAAVCGADRASRSPGGSSFRHFAHSIMPGLTTAEPCSIAEGGMRLPHLSQ